MAKVHFDSSVNLDGDSEELPGVKRTRSSHASLPGKNKSSVEMFIDRGQKSIACLVEAAVASEMAHIDTYEENFADDGDEISTHLTGPQAHVLRMSPAQEYANAASMLGPFFVCIAYILYHPKASNSVWLCFLAQSVHMPFSMLYHVQCARFQKTIHPVDNIYRVGDQVFIMVACAIISTALSGIAWYGGTVSFFACLYSYWLLDDFKRVCDGRPVDPSKGGAPGRRHSILMMVILYASPPFFRGDAINAICALVSFALAASLFVTYPLGGYSHAAFHVVLAPFKFFILQIANNVRFFDWELPIVDHRIGLLAVLITSIVVRHCVVRYKTPDGP